MKLYGGCAIVPDEINEAAREWNTLNQQPIEEVDDEEKDPQDDGERTGNLSG